MRLLIRGGVFFVAGIDLLLASAVLVLVQVVYVSYLKERSNSVGEGFFYIVNERDTKMRGEGSRVVLPLRVGGFGMVRRVMGGRRGSLNWGDGWCLNGPEILLN